MLLIIEKKSGNILQCKGKGPKAKLLCNWLESDIQQFEDNALTALEYIEKSDSGEDQFWGGNAFMVDFLRHSVILKYQYGDKEIYKYTKKEIVKALKNWLNKMQQLKNTGY